MDFDSIIVFLFVIAFFVLPSLLKQVLARKKKTAAPQAIKKTPSIFDRIGEQIKKFVQDLEEQARQQKKETKGQESFWETLTEDDADFSEPQAVAIPDRSGYESISQPIKKMPPQKKAPSIAQPLTPSLTRSYVLRSNPLQNAVVWSEILSKPVALRDK